MPSSANLVYDDGFVHNDEYFLIRRVVFMLQLMEMQTRISATIVRIMAFA